MLRAAWLRLVERARRPCDIAWLAAFRILYGLSMATSAERFIHNDWVDRLFVEPKFHFKYFGFHWVEPLEPRWMHALFWVLILLGLCVAAGFLFRWALGLFLLGFLYLQLVDVTTYLNHYYLATLLGALLWFSPAHRIWSVDAWLAPLIRTSVVATGFHDLFRFQLAIVYTFAALAKLSSDWLIHAQPLSIWLASRTDLPVLGATFSWPGVPLLMSWCGFLFDASIPWLLLYRRTRPAAYAVLILFHLLTSVLFPIGMFPWIMIGSALLFFPPDWPRRMLRAFGLDRVAEPMSLASSTGTAFGPLALAAALVYATVQLAVPLRFLAYDGDVRWHEQGMRFSWRVMVREKNGSVTFLVSSPSLGRHWQLSPSRYLTPLQEREMAGQPDLILQLAWHIRRDFLARGFGDVEVRVEALVSFNGRRLAPLVDPSVDLSRVPDGIGAAPWILPAPTTDPPRVKPIGKG